MWFVPLSFRGMGIRVSNALGITATGAGLFWIVFGIPMLGFLTGDPPGKDWRAFMGVVGIRGAVVFYVVMTAPTLRAIGLRFPARPWSTLGLLFWCFLPLAPLLALGGMVLYFLTGD